MSELAVKRIIDAREAKGWTQQEVADMMQNRLDQPSYSRRQYQKIEAGEFPKHKRIIVTTLEEILEIRISDLVYGNIINDEGITTSFTNNQVQSNNELEGIIYVSAIAQALYYRRCSEPQYISDLPRIDLPGIDQQGDEYRIFEVNGDSMQPYYEHGDFLLCERIDLNFPLEIKEFGSYIVVRKKDILLAWLAIKDNDKYVIKNKKLDRIVLPITDVNELWMVKKVMQWQDPIIKRFATE